MRKITCVCNTYFQLLAAVQLKLTLFKADEMTLMLSDHSNNSEDVFRQLSKTNIFDYCYFVKTKAAYNENGFVKRNVKLLEYYVHGTDPLWNNLELGLQDEMIFYNQTNEIYTLFAYLYKKNKKIQVSKFEEGILSYNNTLFPKQRAFVANFLRKITGKKILNELYHNYYCFYPEFYTGELNTVKIPEIKSNGELKTLLSNIFEINISLEEYKTKYIYFSSVYDFEGGNSIGELNLIKKIADLVGKDNLLVKVHPRDDMKRYEKEGLKVDKNSNVPWEAIQLGSDFSNNVFMTANSGSVMSISLLQDKPPKVFYMYKLCDITGNPSAKKTISTIEQVLNEKFMKDKRITISVAESLEEILD